MARASVVVTTHGTPWPLLEVALASLEHQTLADHEVVLVVDGTLDPGGRDVVDRASRRDARLVVVEPGRVGRARALRLGVAASSAPLVAIQDADDASHPRRLEIQVAAFGRVPRLSALGAGARVGRGAGARVDWDLPEMVDPPLEVVGSELLVSNPLVHSGLMVRRSALDRVGGYDVQRSSQLDYDLLLRLDADGAVIARCDLPLVLKRLHPDQWFENLSPLRRAWSSYRLQQHHIRDRGGRLVPVRSVLALGRLGYQVGRGLRRAGGRSRSGPRGSLGDAENSTQGATIARPGGAPGPRRS